MQPVRRRAGRPRADRARWSSITEYYTGTEYKPVQHVAAGLDRPATRTNIIAGLGVSMKSTAWPVLVVCVAICGVVLARAASTASRSPRPSMLSMAGIIVALDAYGPITDNAGGIAEMAELPKEVRDDHRPARRGRQHHQGRDQGLCDRLGRPRRAGAVRRLHARARSARACTSASTCPNPTVIIGLFIGGLVPYLFGAMAMEAVGRAAGSVVVEVRRQFSEIKGIMEGTAQAGIRRARSTC